jgi:hypothetical protein
VFFDSTATLLDESYQQVQEAIGSQLPAGTITGGASGILFQPIEGPAIPLSQLLKQYEPIFKFTAYPTTPPRGKTPEQVASEVELNKAKAAKALAEARKATAGAAKLGGGLPDATARIKAAVPNKL